MYYVYVLRSLKDGSLYKGYTVDPKNRLNQHNKGKTKSTSSKIPWELIYYEACIDLQAAIKREKYFKSAAGRKYLKNRGIG